MVKRGKKEKLVKGIGGWMIIPIIGMFLSIIVFIVDIFDTLSLIGEYYIEWILFLDFGPSCFNWIYPLFYIHKIKESANFCYYLFMGNVY